MNDAILADWLLENGFERVRFSSGTSHTYERHFEESLITIEFHGGSEHSRGGRGYPYAFIRWTDYMNLLADPWGTHTSEIPRIIEHVSGLIRRAEARDLKYGG